MNDDVIKNENYLELNSSFILPLSIVGAISFVSFSLLLPQQSYAEDYKLNIIIKNEDEVNTKADLSIKTDDKEKIKIKINDDPEKIKERISGEPRDKVKVCLEDDDFKDCQTKKLPKDDDSTLKFKLEYEA